MAVDGTMQAQGANTGYYYNYQNPFVNGRDHIDISSIYLTQSLYNNNPYYNSTGIFTPTTNPAAPTDQLEIQNQPGQVPPGEVPEGEGAEEDNDPSFFGGIWQTICSPFKGAWEVVKSCGKYVGNCFSGAWRATGGALGKLFTGHPFEAIEEVIGGCVDLLKAPFELIGDLLSDVGNFAMDLVDGIGNTIGGLMPWNW